MCGARRVNEELGSRRRSIRVEQPGHDVRIRTFDGNVLPRHHETAILAQLQLISKFRGSCSGCRPERPRGSHCRRRTSGGFASRESAPHTAGSLDAAASEPAGDDRLDDEVRKPTSETTQYRTSAPPFEIGCESFTHEPGGPSTNILTGLNGDAESVLPQIAQSPSSPTSRVATWRRCHPPGCGFVAETHHVVPAPTNAESARPPERPGFDATRLGSLRSTARVSSRESQVINSEKTEIAKSWSKNNPSASVTRIRTVRVVATSGSSTSLDFRTLPLIWNWLLLTTPSPGRTSISIGRRGRCPLTFQSWSPPFDCPEWSRSTARSTSAIRSHC